MSGKIRIFADSTCDLPPSWIEEYNIGIVPLYVVFGEQSLRDGVDIT
ncbi:fatty acid-binding protein DegV, partial [Clostridium perfringens]